MNSFDVTILGNNSALPAFGRHPSAQYLKINHQTILVDCGEGTQIRLAEIDSVKAFSISHIFITHLHGDHCFGLMGLLNSFSLMNRTKPLHLFAHSGMKEIIDLQAKYMGFKFRYPLYFHVLPETGSGVLTETDHFKAYFFQLDHRIACTGFRFEQKFGKKKIKVEQLQRYRIPKELWNGIQHGEDYITADGQRILNHELTIPHPPAKSYAYCSDTKYNENILPHIQNVDCAYIESTYLEEKAEMATERYHCTAKQAALLAKKAQVQQLLLGHFSSRYRELNLFEQEAREVFTKSNLAIEGKTFTI